jgi:bifunctional non-homologous end joining protein LigD
VSDDASVILPIEKGNARVVIGEREVRVTNLEKVYFPESGITKGDLLQYYAEIAPALLPHLTDRAMVMKRYPNGIEGDFFFMKRAPTPRPDWIELCTVDHGNGNIIDFPIVQDMAALLWVVNLGCIDLNPWYARCADYNRPDFLHFDLDPVVGAEFDRVRATALLVKNALDSLGMQSYPKTTGSKGIHIYVPIRQGPLQKQVWTFAKSLAQTLEQHDPALVTAEYRIAKRPHGRVLVDYNQNAWGRTLSSVYSVRPRPGAPVSTPVTWEEIENGVAIDDFNIFNVPARVAELGDLWAPVVDPENRFDLERYL